MEPPADFPNSVYETLPSFLWCPCFCTCLSPPSFPVYCQHGRVILKCRSIHKYFPAQTSNDFTNLQLPIVGCPLPLCCHMLWLSRQPQEPAVVPCTYQACSYLIAFCLCCFFCLEFSSTRNVQGPFWPPLGLCFKSNIIFSRRSSMTNVFIKLYHPTSNSRTPYPNLCFFSTALI